MYIATPVKFSELCKNTSDLLNRDFPIGLFRVEGRGSEKVTNKTVSKLNITGSRDQVTGSIQGELKSTITCLVTCPSVGKLSSTSHNNTSSSLIVENTATLFNNGSLTEQIEVKDAIFKGLNVSTALSLGPNTSGPTGIRVGIDFARSIQKNMALSCNSSFDWFKGPLVQHSSTLKYESLVAGAQVSYNAQKHKTEGYSVAFGYDMPSFKAILGANTGLQTLCATFYQKFASGIETGYKATWNRSTLQSTKPVTTQGTQSTQPISGPIPNPFLLELVSKFPLDPGSWIKTKMDNNGKVSLSYGMSINNKVTMIISGSCDALKKEPKDEGNHKIGFGFVIDI